jgi:hypothetical protein
VARCCMAGGCGATRHLRRPALMSASAEIWHQSRSRLNYHNIDIAIALRSFDGTMNAESFNGPTLIFMGS